MKKINFKALPDKSTPVGPANLNTMQNNIEEAINLKEDRMEVITNENGTAIKYSNGLMICYSYKSTQANINSAWGSLFEGSTENLGSFPQNFIATPKTFVTQVNNDVFIESLRDTSLNNYGYLRVASPTPGVRNVTINLLAIGRWK